MAAKNTKPPNTPRAIIPPKTHEHTYNNIAMKYDGLLPSLVKWNLGELGK